VKSELDLPVTSDIHSPEEARAAGRVLDLLQIPAFLCRQTDLVVAAALTKMPISIKKGQFLAPWDMKNVVKKIEQAGNDQIILMERGTTFGYNNLVSDMRSIPLMQKLGYPVCFDATHSVQLPGGQGETTGGQREFIQPLAQAAVAVGANCLFIEAHPDPANAKSDASSVLDFKDLPQLLERLKALYAAVNTVT
jgi:2-dehydro-3-deoxyphosphooctonate aldolase (KDO 8-P synthase)